MIELNNLTKKFDQRGIAGINGVSFELKKGEVLAIMGPNGSGKTTLINLISKKITPDGGTLKVDGQARIFSGIEEVEDINVQKFLIKSNTHEIDDDKKLQLARDFADIFQFTFQLRQNLSQLSAGQHQKVALAAELINRPALLLLDEPFTHLDPHSRKDILDSLFNYIRFQETSVLWVTHELEEALKLSDRIGILNFGRIEQVDHPIRLIESPKNLFVAQFLGYENFLPIKKDGPFWQTPWGSLPNSINLQSDEAILVIPHNSWNGTTNPRPAKVIAHSIKGTQKIFTALIDQREMQVTLPHSRPLPAIDSVVELAPDLTNCFVIPL